MTPRDKNRLAQLLPDPNLHEVARQADALRVERFGRRTTFAAIEHHDLRSGRDHCPVCGQERGLAPEASRTEASDIHLLIPPGASTPEILEAWRSRPGGRPEATFQLATVSDLAAGGPELLKSLAGEGLQVVSDGVRPRLHPALGETPAREWATFWRDVAQAGLRGHTVVLYGPDHGLENVLDQIDAIAAVQQDCDVFLSVAPVIYQADHYGGVQDGLLTHGSLDLRVLAACRLGLVDVPHVRVLYNRSDLKLAHPSLASGADDLEGHLAFEERNLSSDADAKDLSMREMPRWLGEVGFTAQLRNARMQLIAPSSSRRAEANEGN